MKAIKVKRSEGDTAVLRTKEEFAHYFQHRYMLNKGQTKSMEYAFKVLLGWSLETIDWGE